MHSGPSNGPRAPRSAEGRTRSATEGSTARGARSASSAGTVPEAPISAAPLAPASDGPRLAPLGDGAVMLSLGDRVDRALNERVHQVAAAIRAAGLPWVHDVVPAYAAVAVHYDPLHTDYAAAERAVAELARLALRGAVEPALPREHLVPVRYDGPDLTEVARRTGLTEAEVIARHTAPAYTVYMLGFVPGFAYLGDLDPALVLERRHAPRTSVRAGSVAIAGHQTAIYPLEVPGGWHLIGCTELRPFRADVSPPCVFAPGDVVRFVAVEG